MRYLLIITLILFLQSCKSTEKQIADLQRSIPAKALQKDVKRAKKKLFLMHPDLDWYIDKNLLENKFDSLAAHITTSTTPKAFYHQLAPIVAQVRQAHSKVIYPATPILKNTKRELTGSVGPLSQLKMDYKNARFVMLKDSTLTPSIPLGSEIIALDSIILQQWIDTVNQLIIPDGHDRPFSEYYITQHFNNLFSSYYGPKDSLKVTYTLAQDTHTKTIYRISKSTIDSLAQAKKAADTLSDSTKPATISDKNKFWWGYDKATNTWSKQLDFVDSTTAKLSVRNFLQGNAKKVYPLIFDSLQQLNIQHLIVDLRGNPGGRIADMHQLLGYLTAQEQYASVTPQTVINKRRALNFWTYYNLPKWTYPIATPFLTSNAIKSWLTIKQNDNGTYYYELDEAKLTARKLNAFKGRITLWVDEGTFSAAAILAANLKGQENVTIIGRETGGAHNGTVAGRLPVIRLKHSRLKIRIGTMNIIPLHATGIHGKGIIPDVAYETQTNVLRSDATLLELSK